jgi:nucleotide-binding universal stress UspA family protein
LTSFTAISTQLRTICNYGLATHSLRVLDPDGTRRIGGRRHRDERPADPGRWPDAHSRWHRHAGFVTDRSARPQGVREGGLIVVGVDGSEGAAAALDFALGEGRKRGCPVEVVTAWLGSGHLNGTPDSDALAEARARVHRMQEEAVARGVAAHPEVVEVERVVVHDYAGRVLVARAERASMVVVGSGSPSTVTHQLLGSVAEYCVRHAPVPVVIVPAPARLQRRASAAAAQAV